MFTTSGTPNCGTGSWADPVHTFPALGRGPPGTQRAPSQTLDGTGKHLPSAHLPKRGTGGPNAHLCCSSAHAFPIAGREAGQPQCTPSQHRGGDFPGPNTHLPKRWTGSPKAHPFSVSGFISIFREIKPETYLFDVFLKPENEDGCTSPVIIMNCALESEVQIAKTGVLAKRPKRCIIASRDITALTFCYVLLKPWF